jgi:hypothetical protein
MHPPACEKQWKITTIPAESSRHSSATPSKNPAASPAQCPRPQNDRAVAPSQMPAAAPRRHRCTAATRPPRPLESATQAVDPLHWPAYPHPAATAQIPQKTHTTSPHPAKTSAESTRTPRARTAPRQTQPYDFFPFAANSALCSWEFRPPQYNSGPSPGPARPARDSVQTRNSEYYQCRQLP